MRFIKSAGLSNPTKTVPITGGNYLLNVTAVILVFLVMGCTATTQPVSPTASPFPSKSTSIAIEPSQTPAPAMTAPGTEPTTATASVTSSPRPSPSITPGIASLKAQVVADSLSCRYGPGPEYLYLYGLRKGANINLIGWTGGSNWVWVDGKNPCWVNARYLEIEGDISTLPVSYPEPAKLPRSPYYSAPVVLSAVRDGDWVTVEWVEIPLRAGDEEDETMSLYIVETWRCEDGRVIFKPLATNHGSISFIDQPGCTDPSHGRIFFQEKHGFAGPSEIPWPVYQPSQ